MVRKEYVKGRGFQRLITSMKAGNSFRSEISVTEAKRYMIGYKRWRLGDI